MFHEVIKRINASSFSKVENKENERFELEPTRHSSFFLEQLHGHHTIENQHFFRPFLKLDKRLDRAFEILDSDHEELLLEIIEFSEKQMLL